MSDPCAKFDTLAWNNTDDIRCTKGTDNVLLSAMEQDNLSAMYEVMYGTVSADSVCITAKKVNTIYIGKDIYGSAKSRSHRSSIIYANWASDDGTIVDSTDTFVRPGQIDYFLVHNIMANDSQKTHILAKMNWFQGVDDDSYQKPITPWKKNVLCPDGPAAFMPVQRIRSKAVYLTKKAQGQTILYICPRDRLYTF